MYEILVGYDRVDSPLAVEFRKSQFTVLKQWGILFEMAFLQLADGKFLALPMGEMWN